MDKKNTLFRMVPAKKSGIRFANHLLESDTANGIFYEYYYNGSGLAIGDLNNDGLSDIFFGANYDRIKIVPKQG